jgi:glycolate oxidase FAD binding subunit
VLHRKALLERLLGPLGVLNALDDTASRAFWRAIRDVTPFAAVGALGNRHVWRLSTAPSRGAEVGGALVEKLEAAVLYDWAGGLIWAAVPPADDAGAGSVRAIVAAAGGHATLIRAPAATRAAVDVFAPETGALSALTKRLHDSFDPRGVLNAGRMWAGV